MPVDPSAYPIDAAAYRAGEHGWLAELDRVAVHVGEPHQRMATRAVDEAEWLGIDHHRRGELELRRRLLDEAGDEVFAALPGSDDACVETEDVIADWLVRHHPDAWRLPDGDHPHPLGRAGLAVQEDLCVMQRDDEGLWRFTAGALCFPSYWRLHDKLGRPQEAVHGPVPHYATDLAAKVNRFFDRLPPGRIVSRRNWGFAGHPLLFVPDVSAVEPPPPDPDHLWLRSERQTLRRLERSDAILFTIKIQLAPTAALAAHPDVARRLADAIDGWSPELAESRGWRYGWLDWLPSWLRAVAGNAEP